MSAKFATGGLVGASVLGAIDGLAASADIDAEREYTTTGVSLGFSPILAWGWASGVQTAMIALGAGAMLSNHPEVGEVPFVTGAALVARALTFKLAQRGQAVPAATQGFVTGEAARRVRAPQLRADGGPNDPPEPGRDQEPGSIAYAYALDQRPGALA